MNEHIDLIAIVFIKQTHTVFKVTNNGNKLLSTNFRRFTCRNIWTNLVLITEYFRHKSQNFTKLQSAAFEGQSRSIFTVCQICKRRQTSFIGCTENSVIVSNVFLLIFRFWRTFHQEKREKKHYRT